MIKRRGTTYWVDTRIDGRRLRFSLKTTDLAEAQRLAPGAIAQRLEEDDAVDVWVGQIHSLLTVVSSKKTIKHCRRASIVLHEEKSE